jgi:hypothetical protein
VTQWPFRENKAFYLRITIDARGCFCYVDGRAYAFTPHPPSWDPARAHSLVVQVPIAGDAGEKVTWRVLGLWWGACAVDAAGEALLRAAAAALANQKVQTAAPGECFVTGLRDGTREADLREAFRSFDVAAVRMGVGEAGAGASAGATAGGGAATIVLRDAARVAECVAATNRRLAVLGAIISVAQGFRMVPAMSAATAAAAAASSASAAVTGGGGSGRAPGSGFYGAGGTARSGGPTPGSPGQASQQGSQGHAHSQASVGGSGGGAHGSAPSPGRL